jgi:hypothetical protein
MPALRISSTSCALASLAVTFTSCASAPRVHRASADDRVDAPPPLVLPERTQRVVAGWPRWTRSAALSAAAERCAARGQQRADRAQTADASSLDATAQSEALAYVPETFVFNYPLGPLSIGVGFRGEAHEQWRVLYASLARSGGLCVGPQFIAQPVDGDTGCETLALLTEALRRRPLQSCHDGATDAAVVVRAVVTREGWVVPLEASARREHAAIAQCVGRALVAYIGAPHRETAGAETVLALHWSRPRCLR